MRKRIAAFVLLLLWALFSSSHASARELTVFAASSLTEAFSELGALFEKNHPGVKVSANFAGAQTLATQILLGARADLFAAPRSRALDRLVKAKVVMPGTVQTFARSRLVLVVPAKNPGRIERLADVGKSGIKLVVAGPEVPLGERTLLVLESLSGRPEFGSQFKREVLRNVVSHEENVKGVLSKVMMGEADAGFVWAATLKPEVRKKVQAIAIPDWADPFGEYQIVMLKEGPPAFPTESGRAGRRELAEAFIKLLFSPEGQRVLKKHNFMPMRGEL